MFQSGLLAWKPTTRDYLLVLLACVAILAGLGRDGVPAVTAGLRDGLDRPNDELELAYAAFGFGFYPALVAGGALVEALGASMTLLICGAGLMVATGLAAATWSLAVLMLARLLSGLAFGALLPAVAAVLAPWTPPRERGWSMGIVQAALAGGEVLAGPLFWLVPGGFWRLGLALLAGLAALWLLAWRGGFPDRPAAYDDEPVATLPVAWRGASMLVLLPAGLALLQGWGMVLCREWVPAYLLASWHFDIKLSAWVAVLSGIGLVAGCLVGGLAADRSLNHSGNIRSAHQVVPGVGFLLAAFSLIMLPIGEDEGAIAVWLGLAFFGLQAAGTMLWVFAIDIGGEHPGVSAGAIGLGLALGHLVSPMLLYGLARPLPALLGVAALLAAGVLSFRLRPHVELPLRLPPPPEEAPQDEATEEIDHLLGRPETKLRA
jgi:predicted MFS family arabinose efflux permease